MSSPFDGVMVGGRRIGFSAQGIRIAGRSFETSNDAWNIDRQPLAGLVDHATDESASEPVLWLATARAGLFKVRVSRIAPLGP